MADPHTVPPLPPAPLREIVMRALAEDLPWGDVTTEALVPDESQATGKFVAAEEGIIAGLAAAREVFTQLDPALCFRQCVADGSRVPAGATIAGIEGPARAILSGERTALNLLQRMSGIATQTARYVLAIADTGATIVDTRKTVPGLRLLDKYAVRCGGGSNHRFSLSDGMLVKDNHLAMVADGDEGLVSRLHHARCEIPHTTRIEVEVDTFDQIDAALAGGADIILLDNMHPDDLRRAVARIAGRALTEASGGITLDTVRAVAETGVDLISVGALTHSVRALDLRLDLERLPA